jgi:hypothetical protein
MAFNFVVDRVVKDRAYPALARYSAEPYTPEWQEFVDHWPYTVPCELIEHCREFGVAYNLYTVNDVYPPDSYYPVGLGFFDFNIDYFALMTDPVHRALRNNQLRILFYYHEGDNPFRIKERLDSLCLAWELPPRCYQFVSGNTAARTLENFIYFPDHELLYWRRNQAVVPAPFDNNKRTRDFTCLSRTHKWWRATAVADLQRNDLLDNSFWSYNTDVSIDEEFENNPIEIDVVNIRYGLKEFVRNGPYTCDSLTATDHNNHALTVNEHYTDSYCNIVLETHFDTDQSGGVFLTEKIFKPIKYAQPFVIVGPAGSLRTLRSLGYRTFDHAVDTSYDLIENNTLRWLALLDTLREIKKKNLSQWFELCRVDLEHNQQLFLSTKQDRLNTLLNQLQTL